MKAAIAKPKLALFDEDEMAVLLQLEEKLSVWKNALALIDSDPAEEVADPVEYRVQIQAQLELLLESMETMDTHIGTMFEEIEDRIEKAKEGAA